MSLPPPATDDLLLFLPVVTAYRGANGWSREVWRRSRHVDRRTSHDNRLAYAAMRALDHRDARWASSGVGAIKLLAEATGLLNGRELCEASPDQPAVAPRRRSPAGEHRRAPCP